MNMKDSEVYSAMEKMRERAKQLGPTPQLLSAFLHLVISLNDPADRFGHIANAAEWLAVQGKPEEIDLALLLLRTTNPIDKATSFTAIVSRWTQEKLPEKALAVLAEAEEWAAEFENELERVECSCERARFWDEIGDWYDKLDEPHKALTAWSKATHLAQIHQYDDQQQNMMECMSLLRQLAKKFVDRDRLDEATATAESIRNPRMRDDTLTLIRK